MPVPVVIADLSTTASSNFPQGTDAPGSGDDVIRAHAGFIAELRDKLNGTANTGTINNPVMSGTATGSGFTMPAFNSGYISTPNVSGVVAYRSSSTGLAAGTNTIVFDTEVADRAASYNNTTGIFTAPVTGLYQVNCVLRLQNNSAGSIVLNAQYVSRNNATADGADVVRLTNYAEDGVSINAASSAFVSSGACALLLTASDTVRVKETHTAQSLSVLAGSHLSIHFVG